MLFRSYTLTPTSTNTSSRFYARESSWYASGLWNNIQWNGSWNLDNTAYSGWDISTDVNLDVLQVRRAPAGSNPVTPLGIFNIRVSGTTSATTEIDSYPLPRYVNIPSPQGAVGRFYSRESSFYATGFMNNINWDSDWLLDDETKPGWDVSADSGTDIFQIRKIGRAHV